MLHFGMLLAAASMLLLPSTALATVYDFHATEISALSPSPVSFTFSLDTTMAGNSRNGTFFNNVSITENGKVSSGKQRRSNIYYES